MTQSELNNFNQRYFKLEDGTAPKEFLPKFSETISLLNLWRKRVERQEQNKVVNIDDFRKRRRSF